MFGNTKEIAEAVADGLRDVGAVDVVEVGAASAVPPYDLGLLLVGAPTHAFGPSGPGTRESAADQAVASPSLPIR